MPFSVGNFLVRFFGGLFKKQNKKGINVPESQAKNTFATLQSRIKNPPSEPQKDYDCTAENTLELLEFDGHGATLGQLSNTFETQPTDDDFGVTHMASTMDLISLMSDQHKRGHDGHDSGFISMFSETDEGSEPDEALVEEGKRLVAVMSSIIWLSGEMDDVTRVLEAFD
jgi:hypothetical protein